MKNAIGKYLEKFEEEGELRAKGYFEECGALMDDDIREDLHEKLAPCSDSDFLQAYCEAHSQKFGEEFEIY